MMAALVIGMLVGLAFGAVLVDVLFVQPLHRENKELQRVARGWKRNAANWEALASWHPGTPYIRTGYGDNGDHSKTAELRAVR